ncbi:pyrimidine (deoxy)nucleoside triphosphate pyrophosphohydrolase [Pelagimonas phthalicica]|uniref:Pyrimidine (Deoxy)nucleoside triphosphate pyrophosphohydrolase n=1 Tax=Pelagimonas phthalicica TaxID=1037362 RepID=A0A238JDI4_9RHOB|nr:NUDIX hydrolase [Pelagimonas phthalicica]TDS91702.1 ADP-ribose pyrophosphatase YjhB (NUDIX family) [Pelagimonas phthalicica]SMX28751.1 pyrimidine (deoxy)nucleoside triphosphate pyrophosphohydrolase [Pelagimonas phthalicica]
MAHDHSCSAGCGCGAPSTGPRPEVSQAPAPWRPRQTVRVISIGIFTREGQILAAPVHDDQGQIKGWRPLGGGVEFGETAKDTLIREIKEETAQDVTDLKQIGVLENHFEHHGDKGHEIVFVYHARFAEAAVYQADLLAFSEEQSGEQYAKWIPLEKFRAKRVALYPEGLIDLL